MSNMYNSYGSVTLGGEGWDETNMNILNTLLGHIVDGFNYTEERGWAYSNNLESFESFEDRIRIGNDNNHAIRPGSSTEPAELFKMYEDLIIKMSSVGLYLEFQHIDYDLGKEWQDGSKGVLVPSDGVLIWNDSLEELNPPLASEQERRI